MTHGALGPEQDGMDVEAPDPSGDGEQDAPAFQPRIARGRRGTAGRPLADDAMRIAAIDIGSNSIRQIVADVSPDGKIQVVDEMKAMPRLGKGVDRTGSLADDSMDAALSALARMATLAGRCGPNASTRSPRARCATRPTGVPSSTACATRRGCACVCSRARRRRASRSAARSRTSSSASAARW
jgi:hypothetical protein